MDEAELLFSFLLGLIVVAAGVVALSVRQVSQIQQEVMTRRTVRRLRGTAQPRVTVLVYAHNQAAYIERVLRVLKNNSYHAYDVVLVDDASADDTAGIAKRFCEKNPKAPIRVLRRRAKTSSATALQAGYRKSDRGEVVIVCTPTLPITTSFIKWAVASKNERTTWRSTVRESLTPQLSLVAIGTFLERYYWQSTAFAQCFGVRYFKKKQPTVKTGQRSAVVRSGVALLLCAALLAVAFSIAGVVAIWYAWVLATAYGLVAIWLRYGETLRDRMLLTTSVPLALFLIPATSVVREFSRFTLRK